MNFSLWNQNLYNSSNDYLSILNSKLTTQILNDIFKINANDKNITNDDCIFLNTSITDDFVKSIISSLYKNINNYIY